MARLIAKLFVVDIAVGDSVVGWSPGSAHVFAHVDTLGLDVREHFLNGDPLLYHLVSPIVEKDVHRPWG